MRWRDRLFKAILIALGLVLGLALVEVGLRLAPPFPTRVRADRIVLPANERLRFRFEHYALAAEVEVRRNSLGLRGPELAAAAPGALRLITVGGSTTENLYLGEGSTWTDRLAERLGSAVGPLWANNAGLDGQSSFGHLVLLQDHLAGLKPVVLLFLVGVNDVGHAAPRAFDRAHEAGRFDFSSAGGLLRSLARHSEVFSLGLNLKRAWQARQAGLVHDPGLFGPDPTRRAAPLAPPLGADEAGARIAALSQAFLPDYAARLRELVRRTRALGALPVLLTQPAVFGPGIDAWTGWDLAAIEALWALPGGAAWDLLERYNETTRQIAAEQAVPLVDLARHLPKAIRLYYDPVHHTPEGARRLGELAADMLCPILQARHPDKARAPCPP